MWRKHDISQPCKHEIASEVCGECGRAKHGRPSPAVPKSDGSCVDTERGVILENRNHLEKEGRMYSLGVLKVKSLFKFKKSHGN